MRKTLVVAMQFCSVKDKKEECWPALVISSRAQVLSLQYCLDSKVDITASASLVSSVCPLLSFGILGVKVIVRAGEKSF